MNTRFAAIMLASLIVGPLAGQPTPQSKHALNPIDPYATRPPGGQGVHAERRGVDPFPMAADENWTQHQRRSVRYCAPRDNSMAFTVWKIM
jgi:hypothetical protein